MVKRGVIKFAYIINNTCSLAQRNKLYTKIKITLRSEDHLKILA